MTMTHTTVIHWFRKGLRIHDNPALVDAIDIVKNSKKEQIYLRPIFVLDPGIVKWMKVGPNRWRFLQESLSQLNENLMKINSKLYVVRGNPNEVFPKLFKEWNVTHLTFESDIEPYAVKRDKIVEEQAISSNVTVIQQVSHTVFDPNIIIAKNQGLPPLTYQKFNNLISTCKISSPLPAPKVLTFKKPINDAREMEDSTCYDVPALSDLTNESLLGANLFPGGETEGLNRMESYLQKTNWICAFEKPNTAPNSLEPSTTVLSPYLKFGCLSSRLFYVKLLDILNKNKKHSQPPVSLLGQLIWREFYYCVASATPNFDRMVGNSVCLQVPWDKNEKFLHAWTHGLTGYPFIDAIMRQLRQEGWIHHLARHAVACFLTRGDLWISWEEGQSVFEEFLLDADWALNAGNWMWLSASAFFHQYFRVYSPVAFGKKTDPQGTYIKKYVPELKKYPSSLIYEPWKATVKVQQELGCIIGRDYPARIVVHEDVYKENISRMSKAYKVRKDNKELESNNSITNYGSTSAKKRKSTKNFNETSPISKYFKKS